MPIPSGKQRLDEIHRKVSEHKTPFVPSSPDIIHPQQTLLAAAAGANFIPYNDPEKLEQIKIAAKETFNALAVKQVNYEINKGLQPIRELLVKTKKECQHEEDLRDTSTLYGREKNTTLLEALQLKKQHLEEMIQTAEDPISKNKSAVAMEREISNLVDSHYDNLHGPGSNNMEKLTNKVASVIDKECKQVCKSNEKQILDQTRLMVTATQNSKSYSPEFCQAYSKANQNIVKPIYESIRTFKKKPDISFFKRTAKVNLAKSIPAAAREPVNQAAQKSNAEFDSSHHKTNFSRR